MMVAMPVLRVVDGARGHDARHRAGVAGEHGDEALPVQAHATHHAVHEERGARHVAALLQQADEGEEDRRSAAGRRGRSRRRRRRRRRRATARHPRRKQPPRCRAPSAMDGAHRCHPACGAAQLKTAWKTSAMTARKRSGPPRRCSATASMLVARGPERLAPAALHGCASINSADPTVPRLGFLPLRRCGPRRASHHARVVELAARDRARDARCASPRAHAEEPERFHAPRPVGKRPLLQVLRPAGPSEASIVRRRA
jgi:hypothetical protein